MSQYNIDTISRVHHHWLYHWLHRCLGCESGVINIALLASIASLTPFYWVVVVPRETAL